ncbi:MULTISPECIES: transglycosylase SLT domain-containing protein [unclassified Pseudomonas]|uniref:transglycosylase SLT domain-containing protein n=1 Tax=unclassified Pseudomonas TaxID=196821 RepID=UPI000C868E53|nr:lytic transglycosylase [Pseudomonas sp. FW305-3-2-15-C-TSA2]PMV29305.1 lytic transglycosylase [Pseudomonas sp. DP16D-L5]PMV39208.1 lytic transglycosylase [Pseudomonas sp. FW305-3-2-15-A-LB2]PMV45518.1 lytic transglycosylase [Pseudomonas sp. FW305-3-2-15-C-R2A1]PMV52039.1 lytic transglycosylase [Pseudomonas sp. FW305-3-2-15-C-LB1]PMV57186.1 lytic transglycosylase [Pseudomonas sp. GW460-4]PMV63310.1 lytic transglycosylase [Pseudomonas sp. FW305-3-2-15-C-LB3]PMV69748.1 lytic transglycosylase
MATSVMRVSLCLFWAIAANAQPPAYEDAAQKAGIPAVVLYAVALQESGITLRGQTIPWPWTLNIAGASYYYPTRAQACSAIQTALEQVAPTRIDAGLAQLNLGYQQHHYQHPCELLNPYRNLAVAASILRQHYRPEESWLAAIGRYHRPAGGELAVRYRNRVSVHLARLTHQSPTGSRSQ